MQNVRGHIIIQTVPLILLQPKKVKSLSAIRVFGILALLWIGGCGSVPDPDRVEGRPVSPEFVSSRSTVDRLPEEEETWILTPPYFPEGRYGPQVSLLAQIGNDGQSRFLVYLFVKRVEWAYLENAFGPGGKPLEVEFFGRQVGSPGAFEERVGAVVSRELLEGGADDGLELVFRGRGGQQPVTVPEFLIEGFLMKLDRYAEGTGQAHF